MLLAAFFASLLLLPSVVFLVQGEDAIGGSLLGVAFFIFIVVGLAWWLQ